MFYVKVKKWRDFMRLVDFVSLFNRKNTCINSHLVIRSNSKPNSRSYYFRNVKPLNDLFKEIFRLSQLQMSSFEALFLKNLPDCLSQIELTSNTSDHEISNKIKAFYQTIL
jgi:hypothetical protein